MDSYTTTSHSRSEMNPKKAGGRFPTIVGAFLLVVISLFAIGFPRYSSDSLEFSTVRFAGWNSYLDIVNIIEVSSSDKTETIVRVNFHQNSGNILESIDFTLMPGEQRDIIVNDFSNYTKDSYGLVSIESVSRQVAGRMSYYRNASSGSNFEFAFSAPFQSGIQGDSFAAFNTFDPNNSSSAVLNWLSIVNLGNEAEKFVIEKRDQTGELVIDSVEIELSPFARFDYEAGHVNPGKNSVGLIRVIPYNKTSSYLSNLTRYGPSSNSSSFNFAFQLQTSMYQGEVFYLPLKNRIGEETTRLQNWLEVTNVSPNPTQIATIFYDESGQKLQEIVREYQPYQQRHLDASSILGSSRFGYVKIYSESFQISAQSMFYALRPNGSVADIYGSQPSKDTNSNLSLSWNRFLEMDNFLTLINPTSKQVDSVILIQGIDGAIHEYSLTLPANGSAVLRLDDSFGTTFDSYGTVTMQNNKLLGEVLRVKRQSTQVSNGSNLKSRLAKDSAGASDEIDFVNNTIDPAKAADSVSSGSGFTLEACSAHQLSSGATFVELSPSDDDEDSGETEDEPTEFCHGKIIGFLRVDRPVSGGVKRLSFGYANGVLQGDQTTAECNMLAFSDFKDSEPLGPEDDWSPQPFVEWTRSGDPLASLVRVYTKAHGTSSTYQRYVFPCFAPLEERSVGDEDEFCGAKQIFDSSGLSPLYPSWADPISQGVCSTQESCNQQCECTAKFNAAFEGAFPEASSSPIASRARDSAEGFDEVTDKCLEVADVPPSNTFDCKDYAKWFLKCMEKRGFDGYGLDVSCKDCDNGSPNGHRVPMVNKGSKWCPVEPQNNTGTHSECCLEKKTEAEKCYLEKFCEGNAFSTEEPLPAFEGCKPDKTSPRSCHFCSSETCSDEERESACDTLDLTPSDLDDHANIRCGNSMKECLEDRNLSSTFNIFLSCRSCVESVNTCWMYTDSEKRRICGTTARDIQQGR